MRFADEMLRLYAVTDRSWLRGSTLARQVEAAIRGGATCVQLREKTLCADEFLAEAVELVKICHGYGVPLIINDNVDIALRSGADGVHVGQNDTEARAARLALGPDKIVGVTAKTVEQALRAQEAGADYIGSGAVFGSTTKTDARTMSKKLLGEICSAASIPVVAIGGINLGNIRELSDTGISGAAIVSGIFAAEDIEAECRKLREVVEMIVSR